MHHSSTSSSPDGPSRYVYIGSIVGGNAQLPNIFAESHYFGHEPVNGPLTWMFIEFATPAEAQNAMNILRARRDAGQINVGDIRLFYPHRINVRLQKLARDANFLLDPVSRLSQITSNCTFVDLGLSHAHIFATTMCKFAINKLREINYFNAVIFGVSLIAIVFSLCDVFQFDRMIRGISGLVICCLVIGLLAKGHQRFAILALLGHYLFILNSAQIDTDLALVHLSFNGNQLLVAGYHSPYKGIAQAEVKKPCSLKYSAKNSLILHFNDFCQFLVEVGSEDYSNYVLYASIVISFLTGLALLVRFIANKYSEPNKDIQKLDSEFCSSPRNNSNPMVSSFISSELNSYI